MKLTDFEVLTFDCYGTLIDWETGILQALWPLAVKSAESPEHDRILEDFGAEESAQELETPDLNYREILARVHRRLAHRWGLESTPEAAQTFGASVPDWPAFADSVSSLMYLAKYYKLVILSNVDRESFAGSNRRLEVTFDAVYTAEDIGSYKPDKRNFQYMIQHVYDDFGIESDKILHTAQSLFHDHVPAREHGLANAWIDRRYDVDGWGATKAPEHHPEVDFHYNSLADLVVAHQKALRED
ncbi:MAG: haloacid dehalogenase type II [Acidobacteriota bacterium]|nr:haloacid dehalogenase type II [Acidobacteriota bacterium]